MNKLMILALVASSVAVINAEELQSTKVSEQKKETKVQTPDSFLGYTFGSDVKQCANEFLNYCKRDGHVGGRGSMKKPFRKFTGFNEIPERAVYLEGCVTSRRLYKISVSTGSCPYESVSMEDMLNEFRATCDVITKKYGVSYKVERKDVEDVVYSNPAQGIWWGGKVICEAKFVVGKVRISLKLLDRYSIVNCGYLLVLEATNEEIEQEAKKEVKDSFNSIGDGDGMDAL